MNSSTVGETLRQIAGNIVACFVDTNTRRTRAGLHHDEERADELMNELAHNSSRLIRGTQNY